MTQGGPSDATSWSCTTSISRRIRTSTSVWPPPRRSSASAVLFALSIVSLRSLERGIHYET